MWGRAGSTDSWGCDLKTGGVRDVKYHCKASTLESLALRVEFTTRTNCESERVHPGGMACCGHIVFSSAFVANKRVHNIAVS